MSQSPEYQDSQILTYPTASPHQPLSGGTLTGTLTGTGAVFDTNTLVVDASNNRVGIGTSTPTDTLSLNGPIYFSQVSAPSVTTNRLYNESGNLTWNGSVIGGSTTGNWTTDGTNAWRASGNIGIGTTSPYARLSVVGEVVAPYYTATSTTATTTLAGGLNVGSGGLVYDRSTGYVGISKSNPSYALDVNGFINTSGTTGGYKIDGNLVLQASSTNKSTLVGDGAGQALLVDGLYNTAIGYQALYTATLSDYNTTIGYQAGYLNTTGSYNTFQGLGAGYFNTTGSYNTYNGLQSGYYNVTGSANNIMGFQAGYGSAFSSYASSTIMGYRAGYALTTGSKNLLLGYQAGDNLTTGSNNIILGYDIDAPANDSANTLNIGNLIFGTGIDGTGATLSSGNIGIGTTTPGAKLNIIGALCVDDSTPTCGDSARTDGNIYAVGTTITGIDLAESYPTKDETLGAGEIVMLDKENPVFIERAKNVNEAHLMGIVSTKPGVNLGGFGNELYTDELRLPIALAGRVPTKVNLEGGEIVVGDHITLSSMPGVGMKTGDGPTQTVGIALENFDGSNVDENGVGKILVFVNLSWSGLLTDIDIADIPAPEIVSGSSAIKNASSLLNFFKELGIKIAKGVIETSELIVNKITARKAVLDALEMKDSMTGEVYCIRISNGEWNKFKGTCGEYVDMPINEDSKSSSEENTETKIDNKTDNGNNNKSKPVEIPANMETKDTATTTQSVDISTTTPEVINTDTTPPIITLNGANTIELEVGETYIEYGATAADDSDGDITDSIEVTGDIDMTVAGTYTILYNVSDGAGNPAVEVNRIITVIEPPQPVLEQDFETETETIQEESVDGQGKQMDIQASTTLPVLGE
jgi:hypothetical protein